MTKQKFYSYIEELCAYAIADCEVNDKKADEFWGWFKLKMEEAYKRGREDEAIECQKDMERVVEETKREVMKEIKHKLSPDLKDLETNPIGKLIDDWFKQCDELGLEVVFDNTADEFDDCPRMRPIRAVSYTPLKSWHELIIRGEKKGER